MSVACWFLNYLPVNTLLLILISHPRRKDHRFSQVFTSQISFYSEYRVHGLLKLLKKVEKNLSKKITRPAVKRGKIIKELPDPKSLKKEIKQKNQRFKKDMALSQSKLGRIIQNECSNRFESVRVAVEYLASFFYYECTVQDHEVDDFAVTLANSLIDIIYEDSRFQIFTDPSYEKGPCHCFRESEMVLEINVDGAISAVVIESAKKMDLNTWEVSKILPDDLVIVLSTTYCFRAVGYQPPVFMHRGHRCHIGGQTEKLELESVLRLVSSEVECSRPRFELIPIEMKPPSSPPPRSSDSTHSAHSRQLESPMEFLTPPIIGVPKFWISAPAFIPPDVLQNPNGELKRNKQRSKKCSLLVAESPEPKTCSLESDIGARFKEMVRAELERAKSEQDSRH